MLSLSWRCTHAHAQHVHRNICMLCACDRLSAGLLALAPQTYTYDRAYINEAIVKHARSNALAGGCRKWSFE